MILPIILAIAFIAGIYLATQVRNTSIGKKKNQETVQSISEDLQNMMDKKDPEEKLEEVPAKKKKKYYYHKKK